MVSSWFGVLLALLFGLTVPLPLGIPPRPEDPTLLRALPRDVALAVQWFGLADPDPKSGNVAERFAANAEVRHLFAEVDRAAMAWCMAKEADAEGAPLGPLPAAGLLRVALTNPGIAFVAGFDPVLGLASLRAGIVLRVGAADEGAQPAARLFETLKTVQRRLEKSIGAGEGKDLALAGTLARVLALPPGMPRVVFAQRGEHVFVAVGDGMAEALVSGLEQHDGLGAQPAFTALHAQVRIERPVLRLFADVPKLVHLGLPQLTQEEQGVLDRLGLNGVRQLLLENGLEAEAMRSRAFLAVDGAPGGFLQMLAEAKLQAADLAPIPADASTALAVKLEPAALVDLVAKLVAGGPEALVFEGADAEPREPETADLIAAVRRDLVAGLGGAVTAWNSPGQGGFWFTGATVVIGVRDTAAARRAHERVHQHLHKKLPSRSSRSEDAALARRLEKAGEEIRALHMAASTWRDQHAEGLPRFDDLDWDALGQQGVTKKAGAPPADPWGRPYRIVEHDGGPSVTSDGPDGKPDTDDDLTPQNAWERSYAASTGRTYLEQTTLGAHTLHYLNPGGYDFFAPAWCLTDTHLVVSLALPTLKATLHHLKAHEPDLGTVPVVADAVGGSFLLAQNMRAEFPFLYGIGQIAAVFLCRSLQKDGFDVTVDALPSAVAFRDVLDHELLSLRHVDGGFVLERRGRLPNLLGFSPLLPLPFVFGSF